MRTGMRADVGAVDEVKIRDGNIFVHVIGKQAECFEVMHGERKNQKNITDSVQSNTEKMTNLLSEDVSDEKCKDSNGKRELRLRESVVPAS
ncbi:MAG: hypothetical protein ACLTER_03620 [Ruminococcus sp.]